MSRTERKLPDSSDFYPEVYGEIVPEDVPGSRVIPSRNFLHNHTLFKKELKRHDVVEIVRQQHENGKVVAAKNKGIEIVLYIAQNRSAIAAGGAVVAGLGALYFFRKRAIPSNT